MNTINSCGLEGLDLWPIALAMIVCTSIYCLNRFDPERKKEDKNENA